MADCPKVLLLRIIGYSDRGPSPRPPLAHTSQSRVLRLRGLGYVSAVYIAASAGAEAVVCSGLCEGYGDGG